MCVFVVVLIESLFCVFVKCCGGFVVIVVVVVVF